ncbi:MAG: N-6 DNA methylase [Desulfuromonas thiophila]|nr:N-6 DNA methylase [Desulfuromonas thiophila]
MTTQPLVTVSFLASRWEDEYRQFRDSSEATALFERLKNWNERAKLKETATDTAFINLFFRELWGYALQGDGIDGFQCYPQFPIKRSGQTGGTGKADLALGFFRGADKSDVPQVVCEFKDIRSGLDQKQNRKGNDRSPVRQCLDYLREAKNDLTGNELVEPVWGIVTDTNEFRLYNRLKGEAQCLRFVISSPIENEMESLLAETESADFMRFLFFKIFHRDMLLAERGDSKLTLLLKDHYIHESDLERDFYQEYKAYREHIFKTLVVANPTFSGTRGKLVRLTQRFLDRCLFIMFCEDMGTALDFPCNLLRNVLISISRDEYYNPEDTHSWDRVKSIFRAMRDGGTFGEHRINRFNGGLFEELPELEQLNIPNKIFCAKNQGAGGAATFFAHPQTLLFFAAKYNFGIKGADHQRVIDFYALGRIFEQSITELEIMEAEADGRSSINLLTQRKRDGVYYTPEWITAYIVEETVGARLQSIKQNLYLIDAYRPTDDQVDEYYAAQKDKRKTAKVAMGWLKALGAYRKQLNNLKIVDPACGSGAFLIQTLEQLKREHRWAIDEAARITGELELWDSDAVINDILSNNLYGVDVNAESVEIAKLALWMHTASPGKPLSSLDHNIRCGNSLVGPDFYQTQQTLFSEDEKERINVFDWQTAFPEVFSQGGFDCVVGNPPYVKLQHFRKVQGSCAEYLVRAKRSDGTPCYASAQTGNFDLYLLFIEKGVELLKPEGRMGYIAPNVWMMNEYGKGLREFTKSRQCLDRWVDFKSYQVFNEAITYTALQFFAGQPADAIRCTFVPDGDLSIIDWHTPQSAIPYDELSATDAWNLMPTQERNLIERLKVACKTLEQCSKGIFVGIQTSADAIYHLTRLSSGRYRTGAGTIVELEDAIMHPLVSGAEAKRYLEPETNTYLLFPYDLSGGKPQLFSESEMKSRFSLAFAYLKQHENVLRSREGGKFNDVAWYRFGRNQNIGIQEQSKLLVPRLISRLFCTVDEKGETYLDNVDVGGVIVSQTDSLYYIAGIINAPVCNFVWRRISKPFQNDYRSANKQFIAPLPIPSATAEEKADVANKAKELQRLHTARRTLSSKFEQRWSSSQTEIDKRKEGWLCADAAKRAETYAAWDSLLRPGAALAVENSDDELRLKIGASIALELFDIPDTPFIAAQWRHVLREVNVTESFNAKKLVKLLLNLRTTALNEIKERLVKLDADIRETEQKIRQAEKSMNQLVYQLYGLSAEEIRLVEATA